MVRIVHNLQHDGVSTVDINDILCETSMLNCVNYQLSTMALLYRGERDKLDTGAGLKKTVQ